MAAQKKSAKQGRVLVPFHDRISPLFTVSRFNWAGCGERREPLWDRFSSKVRPPSGKCDASLAAEAHVIVPADAPQDYADLRFLAHHYEACLPVNETIAFVQITIRFPDEPNLHAPFEVVRDWVKSDYRAEGLPAAVILHNPALVGSENVGHVHIMVFPREVNRLGWGKMVRDLANDAGRKAAWMSWQDHWEAAR